MRVPKQYNNILDMFVSSKLPVHILRGIEPNLRFGVAIRNFIENINNMADIPQCNSGVTLSESLDNGHDRNPDEYNGLLKRKCIHLASRKQIGDAIIRYEDKSIINK